MSTTRRTYSPAAFVFAVVALYCLINGASGSLTKTPQNVLVLRGQDAVLNCSTDTSSGGSNPITWKYDDSIISNPPCKSQSPGIITSPPDSATDCNIRALASRAHGISGAYRCEATARAVAMVIVLDPTCEVVQPVIEGTKTTLTCRMTYDWQAPDRRFNHTPVVDVSLSWTGVSGTTVRTTADPATFRGTVETNMTIDTVMARTVIPSYNCTIGFSFSRPASPLSQYAVNPLSYECATRPTTVWYCPSSVAVSPSSGPFKAGDVLTCMSDGYPEPSYTWTDGDGVVVSTGPTVTVSSSHSTLICTATSIFTTPCRASLTIYVNVETRNPLYLPVFVLAATAAALLIVVILMSFAIHRLRQTTQTKASAAKSNGGGQQEKQSNMKDQPASNAPVCGRQEDKQSSMKDQPASNAPVCGKQQERQCSEQHPPASNTSVYLEPDTYEEII